MCHVTGCWVDIKSRTKLRLANQKFQRRIFDTFIGEFHFWTFLYWPKCVTWPLVQLISRCDQDCHMRKISRMYFGHLYGRTSFWRHFILAGNVTWCGYHATAAWQQKCIFFEKVKNLLSTVSWQNFNLVIFISGAKNREHVTWTWCDATWQKCILSKKWELYFRRLRGRLIFLRILISVADITWSIDNSMRHANKNIV